MSFRINLEVFRGPLDLLLYLVRKHEVDIFDIPIVMITDQYCAHLEILEELDIDSVGEFLDLASTLVELKSRSVLPRNDEEVGEIEDPRNELVQRLLEYKRFKDAASILEDQGREWQKRLPRLADDLPPRTIDPADQPIQEVELWDLVSAFGRIKRGARASAAASIVYDDTPIDVYMERISEKLASQGRLSFSEMFEPKMHKSAMVGVFLAILELVRHRGIRTEQAEGDPEIWIYPSTAADASTSSS